METLTRSRWGIQKTKSSRVLAVQEKERSVLVHTYGIYLTLWRWKRCSWTRTMTSGLHGPFARDLDDKIEDDKINPRPVRCRIRPDLHRPRPQRTELTTNGNIYVPCLHRVPEHRREGGARRRRRGRARRGRGRRRRLHAGRVEAAVLLLFFFFFVVALVDGVHDAELLPGSAHLHITHTHTHTHTWIDLCPIYHQRRPLWSGGGAAAADRSPLVVVPGDAI